MISKVQIAIDSICRYGCQDIIYLSISYFQGHVKIYVNNALFCVVYRKDLNYIMLHIRIWCAPFLNNLVLLFLSVSFHLQKNMFLKFIGVEISGGKRICFVHCDLSDGFKLWNFAHYNITIHIPSVITTYLIFATFIWL